MAAALSLYQTINGNGPQVQSDSTAFAAVKPSMLVKILAGGWKQATMTAPGDQHWRSFPRWAGFPPRHYPRSVFPNNSSHSALQSQNRVCTWSTLDGTWRVG